MESNPLNFDSLFSPSARATGIKEVWKASKRSVNGLSQTSECFFNIKDVSK
jgi:hypothetical protein